MNLYAWTNADYDVTFWTDTETPTTSSRIYDSDGTDVTSTYVCGACYISSVNGNSLVFQVEVGGDIPIGGYTGPGKV